MLFANLLSSWPEFGAAVGISLAFCLIGIVLLIAGFKLFDMLTPKLDLEAELAKGNMAVAIVVGSMLVSIGLIVMKAIG